MTESIKSNGARSAIPKSAALCVLMSGCAGLIYQTLWVRQLSEVFGHTAVALAAVAAAFMGGQSLGSLMSDELAVRHPDALLGIYAGSEIAIAGLGWFSRDWLAAVVRFASASRWHSHLSDANGIGWFLVLIVALGLPTFLMGLTLPVLAMNFAADSSSGKAFGRVYGWNTVGAAIGCLLAGIALPPWIGLRGSLRSAALLNASAGGVAAWAGAFRSTPRGLRSATGRTDLALSGLLLAFLSGCVGMTCEVAWYRLLQLLLGSSVQTIGLVLFFILLGIGTGGLCHRALARGSKPEIGSWAWAQFGLAASLIVGLLTFERFFYLAVSVLARPELRFGTRLAAQGAFCAALVFIPCLLMGISLPWLLDCASENRDGPGVGAFYGVNAAGCIVGSIACGFWLLPVLGMERALKGAALLAALPAAAVALKAALESGARRQAAALAVAAAAVVAAVLPRALDPHVLATGVYIYGPNYSGASSFGKFRELVARFPLLYYADGFSATVAVRAESGDRYLQVNGKTDGSSVSDRLTQLMAGYIPLMLNPNAKRVLVVGLGTGTTAGVLARSPRVRSLGIVEIEPRVAEAAAAFFDAENHGVLRDPRVAVAIADARQYARSDDGLYDIIDAEPSNPWIAGVASLYTREHLLNMSRRLAPGGVYCQWFQAYRMSEGDFRMALATFADVFPRVLLFRAGTTNDYLLLGSKDGWTRGLAEARSLVRDSPAIRADLEGMGLGDPFSLLAGAYVFEDEQWRRYTAGSPMNTDDLPALEFSAPKHLFSDEEGRTYLKLESFRKDEWPPVVADGYPARDGAARRREIGAAALALKDFPRALRLLRGLAESEPENPRAQSEYAGLLILLGRSDEGETRLLEVVARHRSFSTAYFQLGELYALNGALDKALSWDERGLRLDPENPRANLDAGRIRLAKGDRAAARRAFERGLRGKAADARTRLALLGNLAALTRDRLRR